MSRRHKLASPVTRAHSQAQAEQTHRLTWSLTSCWYGLVYTQGRWCWPGKSPSAAKTPFPSPHVLPVKEAAIQQPYMAGLLRQGRHLALVGDGVLWCQTQVRSITMLLSVADWVSGVWYYLYFHCVESVADYATFAIAVPWDSQSCREVGLSTHRRYQTLHHRWKSD